MATLTTDDDTLPGTGKAAGPAEGACEAFHADSARMVELRDALLETDAVAGLAQMFKMLGDATRVRILDALSKDELCVCDLATLLGLSESAVSHQLRLLRGLRLVRPRRAGRMVFYALDDDHVISLFREGLRHVQEGAPALRGRTR